MLYVKNDLPPTDAVGGVHFYNNDKELPIFNSGRKVRYTVLESAAILLKNATTQKCTKTPVRVWKNMSFLEDISKNEKWEDIKSDMNGAYTHLLRTGVWTIDVSEDMEVQILEKRKMELKMKSNFHMHINSRRNKFGLSRSIFFPFQPRWRHFSQHVFVTVPYRQRKLWRSLLWRSTPWK